MPGPREDPTDWAVYFRAYREALEARDDNEADREVGLTVLETDDAPDEAGLGTSVAKMLREVRGAGWKTRLRRTRVAHPDEFYASEDKRGEVRKAAHETTHWFVDGWYPSARVAFHTAWIEGVTAKGKPSFKFDWALVMDPVGMPIEMYADYTPSGTMLRMLTPKDRERREADANRQDYTYNTGDSYIERRPSFAKAGEFNEWLAEWLAITTPKHPIRDTKETQ